VARPRNWIDKQTFLTRSSKMSNLKLVFEPQGQ
jgi:hypothetical protein